VLLIDGTFDHNVVCVEFLLRFDRCTVLMCMSYVTQQCITR